MKEAFGISFIILMYNYCNVMRRTWNTVGVMRFVTCDAGVLMSLSLCLKHKWCLADDHARGKSHFKYMKSKHT